MKITQISHRNKRLNFSSDMNYSSKLPAMIWREVILVGHSDCLWGVDLDPDTPLEQYLKFLISDLSFVRFVRLVEALEDAALSFDLTKLAKSYDFQPHQDFIKVISILKSLSPDLKVWLAAKNFNFGDLQPLLAVSQLDEVKNDLLNLLAYNFTHSEAVIVWELVIELRLMGQDLNEVWSQEKSTAEVIQKLKNRRYPLEQVRRDTKDLLIKTLPWPKKVSVRSSRMQDQSGVEVKFFVHSKNEMKKNIDGLLDVMNQLEQQQIERF